MARSIVAVALVTYALAVFQVTLGGRLAVRGFSPDLLFVWTVCLGLVSGPHVGAIVGFASGVMEGGLQQAWIGALAIGKSLSGFAAGVLAAKMFKENLLVPVLCAGLLTVLNEGSFLLLSRSSGWPQAARLVEVRVLYHAALAPLGFALLSRARRRLSGRPGARG